MKAGRRATVKSAIELTEEAVHLLRQKPVVLLEYYVGALPFVLGGLCFWMDMARSPLAYEHLAGGSLGMGALFLWMKFWQAIFAGDARALLAGEPRPRLSWPRGRRVFAGQALLQPTGLFLLPAATALIVPFPWFYAFYQNATVLADQETGNVRALLKTAWKQTGLWPAQMFLVLAIVFVFATCVFLNWALFCFTLPSLIKMIFGTETVFTRSGLSLLNTSFFAIMVGLTYLCVDPLAKMVFVLRCFYGQSRESGADLKAELKHYAALAGQVAAALALLLVGAPDNAGALERPNTTATPGIISPVTPVSVFLYQTAALDAPAGETAASATLPRDAGEGTAAGVAPHELGRAIEKVLEQRKFAWRMPREKIEKPKTESGVIGRFFERVSETLRKWLRELREWLADWLRKLLRNRWHRGTTSGSGYGWILALQLLLYGLLAFTVGALAVLVYRITRGPRNKRPVVAAQSILPTPDLADENVGAEQLPEDGWTRLGRELLERGELRLALRAFYLASLAHLAARNLIHLAKFKSNSDYEQELRRRGHSFPGLLARFTENVQVFDRVWYGMHQINTEVLNQFVARVEQLKAG